MNLYGIYGNDESQPGPANNHFVQGMNEGAKIVPRCTDGSTVTPCSDTKPPVIVFLFIGFSNCTLEICGGATDIWNSDPNLLAGQPCATPCRNPSNGDVSTSWNQTNPYDQRLQRSLMYQAYHDPNHRLVGPSVYIFDAAVGGETLDRWDPHGYYQTGDCKLSGGSQMDPECDYDHAMSDLTKKGFTEAQVQAIFIKTSTSFPSCDLSGFHCTDPANQLPDAYQSEIYLGNIMRYLKHGLNGTSRYPNLHQVFITSRTYGGYAQLSPFDSMNHGCLSPEPFSYEEAFAVQRLIVAQIKQSNGGLNNDLYSGSVKFQNNPVTDDTPWFDWGPYLWTSGDQGRSDRLVWCNGQQGLPCNSSIDVRSGDPQVGFQQFWGDFTHPSYKGVGKVADLIVDFLTNQNNPNHAWVGPWIGR